MWTQPTAFMVRLYNALTVLSSLTCAVVFLQLIRLGLNHTEAEGFSGTGFLVGAVWLVVPIIALVMVAIAHFPSVSVRARGILSGMAFLWVLVFAVIPLTIVLYA